MVDPIDVVPVNRAIARPIHEMTIPLANNATNSIRKPDVGGCFELKQNIVKLLHISGNLQVYIIRTQSNIYKTSLRSTILKFSLGIY